jgi:hypothetical protein
MGTATEGEFAATANLDNAKTDAERKVVECFAVLEIAELNFEPGKEFGSALVKLREEIKKSGGRNFMERLEQLGITYAKARYWIAVVEGKPISRGAAKKEAQRASFDWHAATDQLEALRNNVYMLKISQPDGDEPLIETLTAWADELGYDLVKRGEGSDGLLQRVRQADCGMAQVLGEGKADSAGCGR